MIRLGTALWLIAVCTVGWGMFQVKYEVMQLEDQLARVNKQIADGNEAIRVLNAEWSLLTQPARLDQLAKRYLNLQPIGTQQLVRLDQVPLRGEPEPAVGSSTPPSPAPARQKPVHPAAPAASSAARQLAATR
jgi:cell division protein FtsL